MNPREEEILHRMRDIIQVASKYSFSTGLHVNFVELENLRRKALIEGNVRDAEEIEFVLNYLKVEKDEQDEVHKTRVNRVNFLKKMLPIGMLINFRSILNGNVSGEIVGYLSDRVLVKCLEIKGKPIVEVNPFDIKT